MIERAQTENKSEVNVFELVLGENVFDGEYNGIEDERYHRIHTRNINTNRRISRRYIRPIFKEAGSKHIRNNNALTYEQREHLTIPMKVKRTNRNLEPASNPTSHREHNECPTIYKDDDNLFNASLFHKNRLEYIVGNPVERHEFEARDKPVTLRTGLGQRYHQEKLSHLHYAYNNPNIEGPIASTSDVDLLEKRILRPKISSTTQGSQLNVLRRQINNIVSDHLDSNEGRRGFSTIFDSVDFEEREGYEGCVSHGCAGLNFLEGGISFQLEELLNDVKEYWVR